jgi:hypothetical protein
MSPEDHPWATTIPDVRGENQATKREVQVEQAKPQNVKYKYKKQCP